SPVTVGAEHLQLVQPLHVERERALRAVDLPLQRVPASEREAGCLDRSDRAVFEGDGGLDRVVDLPSLDERLREPEDRLDLSVEETGQIDHVRAEIAKGARSRLARVETPGCERGIVGPI